LKGSVAYRASQNPEQVQAADDRRYMTARESDDGMVLVTARLHPEEAARVMEAARVSAESAKTGNHADGLVAMAEATLRGDKPDHSPTEVVVRIDAGTLEGAFADGTGVSAECARRLLCDAGVVPILEDENGDPLNIGRKTRTLSAAIRRALGQRDEHCQFPGCENRRFLDGHHIRHWLDGGETSLRNLTLLCRRHHLLVHEGGFTLHTDERGAVQFQDHRGRALPRHFKPSLNPGLLHPEDVPEPSWDGTRPDYDLCVAAICDAEKDSPVAVGSLCAAPS
jgi:hypothetical protein